MARGGVNKALVQKARASLLSRGENPSIDAVRIEMGNTGSKTTIHRYLKELESTQAPAPDINEELSDLVAHLAQRLQEQAQERIDQAHDQYQAERDILQRRLAATQEQISQLEKHAQQREETLEQQAAAMRHTQGTLQEERLRSAQDENAALKQGMTDAQQQSRMLELLLTKKEAALENLQIRLDQPDIPKAAKKKPSDQT